MSEDPSPQRRAQQQRFAAYLDNLRPQTVTDEVLLHQKFFNARDLVQVKYEMLRRVEKDGHSISEAAAAFGFSRPSFYQVQFAFQEGCLAGLVPLKQGPKKAYKLTPEIIEFLRGEFQQDPSLRALQLATLVRRDFMRSEERFHVVVHPRTIEPGLARSQKKRRKPE